MHFCSQCFQPNSLLQSDRRWLFDSHPLVKSVGLHEYKLQNLRLTFSYEAFVHPVPICQYGHHYLLLTLSRQPILYEARASTYPCSNGLEDHRHHSQRLKDVGWLYLLIAQECREPKLHRHFLQTNRRTEHIHINNPHSVHTNSWHIQDVTKRILLFPRSRVTRYRVEIAQARNPFFFQSSDSREFVSHSGVSLNIALLRRQTLGFVCGETVSRHQKMYRSLNQSSVQKIQMSWNHLMQILQEQNSHILLLLLTRSDDSNTRVAAHLHCLQLNKGNDVHLLSMPNSIDYLFLHNALVCRFLFQHQNLPNDKTKDDFPIQECRLYSSRLQQKDQRVFLKRSICARLCMSHEGCILHHPNRYPLHTKPIHRNQCPNQCMQFVCLL